MFYYYLGEDYFILFLRDTFHNYIRLLCILFLINCNFVIIDSLIQIFSLVPPGLFLFILPSMIIIFIKIKWNLKVHLENQLIQIENHLVCTHLSHKSC